MTPARTLPAAAPPVAVPVRVRRRTRWPWQLAAVGACVLAAVLLLSAVEPPPAQAWILGLPSPGQVISGLLGGIGSVIGGTVGKLAVTAFDAIIHALFAPIAHFINTQLIGWLVAVPDYAPAGSHVAATERTVLAMAGAALGAVATISIARFWLAGLAGSGGSALEGLARTVGAALLLPIWPWMFHAAVALANDASTGLLGSGSVTKSSANLLAVGVGAGVGLGFLGVGLFVSIVMAVVASILFLGLLMMKVVLAISTVLVFIGMPIAIVLSPVVPWISRVLVRAFAVCLAVPFVWAVCFAASAAMLNDGLFLKGSSGFFNALLEPLAAIALLWMMLLLPTRLAQMAMLGAGSVRGGFMSRAVSYAAGSQARDVARQHLPGWAGGGSASDQRSRATDARLGTRLSAESVLAASKAAGAGAGAGGRGGGGRGSGECRGRGRRAQRRARRVQRLGRAGGGLAAASAGRSERARVLAAAAGKQPGRDGGQRRSAAAELAAGSFRRRDARGVAARAAPAGLRRAGPAGARRASGLDPGRGAESGRRPRAAGAAASRLPGARRMDAGPARGDPNPRRGQSRGSGPGIRRRPRVDVGIRRERRPQARAYASGDRSRRAGIARMAGMGREPGRRTDQPPANPGGGS